MAFDVVGLVAAAYPSMRVRSGCGIITIDHPLTRPLHHAVENGENTTLIRIMINQGRGPLEREKM